MASGVLLGPERPLESSGPARAGTAPAHENLSDEIGRATGRQFAGITEIPAFPSPPPHPHDIDDEPQTVAYDLDRRTLGVLDGDGHLRKRQAMAFDKMEDLDIEREPSICVDEKINRATSDRNAFNPHWVSRY